MPASVRLFVQHLTVMDVAVLDAQRGLYGQSWIVDIELEGALDQTSMVWDFGEVKRAFKQHIDAVADHVLLVPANHPAFTHSQANNQHTIRLPLADGSYIEHTSPAEAICLLPCQTVDVQTVTKFVTNQLTALLVQQGLPHLTAHVRLKEESIPGASYSYCHGLKKHAGNCQRIAHGHRSALRVWGDGTECTQTAQRLATQWHDQYLGTAEDLQRTYQDNGVEYHEFAHTSSQGHFILRIPTARVDMLPHDTTVELLAQTLAQRAKQTTPYQQVQVQAFEGVHKGAFGHAA